jgi:integrase
MGKRPGKKRKGRSARGKGAAFYAASKGCWVARAIIGTRPDGRPHYKEIRARTQADALARKERAEADARAGRGSVVQQAQTFGEFLSDWVHHVSKPTVRETTWESYERCVRLHIQPLLGGGKVADLTPTAIEKFFRDLSARGCSPGNAKKVAQVLGTALSYAQSRGLIPVSPMSVVAHPKPEVEEIIPFTPEEVKGILKAIEGHRLHSLFVLAACTGMRLGELLGLSWPHVDLVAGTIRVERSLAVVRGGWKLKEPKSKRGRRVIDIPPFAVAALTARLAGQQRERTAEAPVIFCTRNGQFISRSSFLRQTYARTIRKAGVPYRKFHTFRHTHASELLSRGVPVVDVARRLGDRPEVILQTYAHYIPGNTSGIASRLEEMYATASPANTSARKQKRNSAL